jgi:hypothetical protein
MAAVQRTVLSRLEVCCVTAVLDGDRVVSESAGQLIRVYSGEELLELYARAVSEVQEANRNGNRAGRRARARARVAKDSK